MTDIDGYTNHLLNVLNGVNRQAGRPETSVQVIYEIQTPPGNIIHCYSVEELNERLERAADVYARDEAQRRVGGNSPYEPLVEREYDRIMELAKK